MTTTTTATTERHTRPGTLARRVTAADWTALAEELNTLGCAVTPRLLTPADCRALSALYDGSAAVDGTDPASRARFRSTIDMARHRFGSGQYRYFADPLPTPVQALREAFYPHLREIARDWADKLGRPAPWPDTLEEWLTMCHEAGQTKSSQILLRYGAGDWNALHRDIFGEMVFPLQVVIGLDEQGTDYTGGEFLLVEQRPRAQSRGTSTVLPQGHGLIFTTRDRPVRSARGWSAAPYATV